MAESKGKWFWGLAAITYGMVIVTSLLAYFAYRQFAATEPPENAAQKAGTIAVGTIWVPVYPGAMLETPSSSTEGNVTEGRLNFKSLDSTEKVLAFYRTRRFPSGSSLSRFTATADGGVVRNATGTDAITVTVRGAEEGSEGEIVTSHREVRK